MSDLYSTLQTCSDSSPGPDGIPYSLIKFTWSQIGPLLLNSWNYACSSGNLSPSHESSYLKLLPKEGKDLTLLKNWRPITLSNCDFKLITKTLASKLTTSLSNLISHNQTAYIKNRQITDNLHILQHTTHKCTELDTPSMIVSLDAEKAFDSIEHWYLRDLLRKIGLSEFVKIFDLIYKNQNVSIQVNNREAGKYKIKNGVKQGDALSCILFILGIEPLIKNINLDPVIKNIKIHEHIIPKIVAYADDVACIIEPNQVTLQKVFSHYQNMSDVSGLNLNADKTEVICHLNSDRIFRAEYNSKIFNIQPCTEMKVNGLYISYDNDTVWKRNFEKVLNSVESQLRSWSVRNLTLMGKIQIFKTFGLSQILFIASTNLFNKSEEKQLENVIYKFIWNKDMSKSKAPDRLKRSILRQDTKDLGFGMIDFKNIVSSIRLKTILRLLNESDSPLHDIITMNVTNSVTNIKVLNKINPVIDNTILLIKNHWKSTLKNCPQNKIQDFSEVILNEYIGNIIYPRFHNKRMVLNIKHNRLGEVLLENPTHPIINKLDNSYRNIIKLLNISKFNPTVLPQNYRDVFPINDCLKKAYNLTSKQIRKGMCAPSKITPKLITSPDSDTLAHLGNLVKKLTNVRLKTTLLRAMHGDIYCGTRLKKFGMSDSDLCMRCNTPETIEHQIYQCGQVKQLWDRLSIITSIKANSLNDILGHNLMHDKTTLTLHAEIIRLLLAIDRPAIDPSTMIKGVLNRLMNIEKGISKHNITKMIDTVNNQPNP